MRRIRYQVAASLDGYIAGPKGEAKGLDGPGGRATGPGDQHPGWLVGVIERHRPPPG